MMICNRRMGRFLCTFLTLFISSLACSITYINRFPAITPSQVQSQYLPAWGPVNQAGVSEAVVFGDPVTEQWITDMSVLSAVQTDANSGRNYRQLAAGKNLEIQFPAFNIETTDANGFCLTDMLIEAGYKDTVAYGNSSDLTVSLNIRCDYINLDPNYLESPQNTAFLSYVGGFGDMQWKYLQCGLEKSPFQRIRAIGGKFIATVYNRAASPMPLSYVTLRTITSQDYATLAQYQRTAAGFYEVHPPDRAPVSRAYADPAMKVFCYDLMRPVYSSTVPDACESEIVKGFGCWGQTEAMSLAIYSQTGITGISMSVGSFTSANGTIPADQISLQHVVHAYKQLNYSLESFAFVPERLEQFNSLDIAPGTSERFWIKVAVPAKTQAIAAGMYSGQVRILRAGALYRTVPIQFEIMDITLDELAINNVWHDPYTRICSPRLSVVFDAYRETKIEPFIYNDSHCVKVSKNSQGSLVFDTANFQSALDSIMQAGSSDGKINLLVCPDTWHSLYNLVMPSPYNESDPNLFFNLADSRFVTGMRQLLNQYVSIAGARNVQFVFHFEDEPSTAAKRIVCLKLFSIVRQYSATPALLTGSTYGNYCDDYMDPAPYNTPSQSKLEPLTSYVDYKIWSMADEGAGFSKYSGGSYPGFFGYYTTWSAQYYDPVYNRFLHGFFAIRTGAQVVCAYAMGDYVGDPYNDFDLDQAHTPPFAVPLPDFLFAYPTWNGELLYRIGGLEGIREGIKDARYAATLKRLISLNPGTPTAVSAQQLLDSINSRINPDYSSTYLAKANQFGFASSIIASVSTRSDPCDYEAFTLCRRTIADYIIQLQNLPTYNAADFNRDGIVNSLDYTMFCRAFMQTPADPNYWTGIYDLSGNGRTNLADMGIFAENWLVQCSAPQPILYFKFDETSGLIAHDFYSLITGTLVDFPSDNRQWVAGEIGSALKFSRTDKTWSDNYHVQVPYGASFDVNYITMAAWVKLNSYRGYARIISKESTQRIIYSLMLSSSGKQLSMTLAINGLDYQITGTATLPLNTWTHVAGIYDGSKMLLYINGKPAATTAKVNVQGQIMHGSQPLYIGASQFSSSRMFDGCIDELLIYNLPLMPAEIQKLASP
jgi:hypothetical protein